MPVRIFKILVGLSPLIDAEIARNVLRLFAVNVVCHAEKMPHTHCKWCGDYTLDSFATRLAEFQVA
jgi:ArsR family metal-binding transcriptional regulator